MQDVAISKLNEEAAKHPEWANWDNTPATSQAGTSTAEPSATTTPAPASVTGPKLRLNFTGIPSQPAPE